MADIGTILDDIRQLLETNIPLINITVFQVILAILVLLIGLAVVKIIVSIFRKNLTGRKLPELAVEFLSRLIGAFGNIAVILFAVSMLGFDVNSLVLGLSAIMGLILAFGMQDTFTNFFAGIWLSALRPIDKDEVVNVAGITGKVSAVGIMATEFLTPDNKYITVPNKLVWGSPIENYSRMPIRRVDVDVGIGYSESVENAIKVAMQLMRKHKMVLKDPAPTVVSTALADSSVNLQLRPWAKTDDYWTVKDDITQGVLNAYRDAGIEIPFPQMDVHLDK
jgi:small-conductance mechanosensitive channel